MSPIENHAALQVSKPDLNDPASIRQFLLSYLVLVVGVDPENATQRDWYYALAYLLRGELNRRMMETQLSLDEQDSRQMYYLSMEYLPGKALLKNIIDRDALVQVKEVLSELGQDLDRLAAQETDSALGNGGLGRLAACYMESLATHRYPAMGYGVRYEFGMFTQSIEEGRQVEHPEGWLRYGNPWEVERPNLIYQVHYYGKVDSIQRADGQERRRWVDTKSVIALAFDTPISGYHSPTATGLRLWSARSNRDFDLLDFNQGNYVEAVSGKTESENISKVLYPNDATASGQELRLKQEYFFVSASLQDIVHTHLRRHKNLDSLAEKICIQLNDTHPAQAVSELMRLLVDEYDYPWQKAWEITRGTFSYTNHTLLPEALETWPIDMMQRVLPRHLEIIYRINQEFLDEVSRKHPNDLALLRRTSLVDDQSRRIRMAHLAIVGSNKVNGVAELHTELLRTRTFPEFNTLFPGRFVNVTNGITPRRWLRQANPGLSALADSVAGPEWTTEMERLSALVPMAQDSAFRQEFMRVKKENKQRLANMLRVQMNLAVDPDSLFDVQVKRVHEYKRQLLNVLHVLTLYNRILHEHQTDLVPRTVIFSGKAAPGYFMAKLIIRLINDVAKMISAHPLASPLLKVVFIPNYGVSSAEVIIPASDLSEQISTAGTEASGTGNMKLALNGALTIGTLDGANIEILEKAGADNMFVFGLTAHEAQDLRVRGYNPRDIYQGNKDLKRVLDMIYNGEMCQEDPHRYHPIVRALLEGGDHFLLLADYQAYVDCQAKVERVYRKPEDWARSAILNVANLGKFSSDRAVHTYAKEIWNIKPILG